VGSQAAAGIRNRIAAARRGERLVISVRLGLAVSLVLSIAAVALGVTAVMSTIRDEREKPGRLVQTRITNAFDGDPQSFPLDDFFVSRAAGGELRALYAYPPGFFGHMRGCKVVWSSTEVVSGRTGAFVDPCGGARFGRDGTLLSGPADRGLDYFELEPSVEGMIADTRTLYCGPAFAPPEQPAPADTPSAATPTSNAGTPHATSTAASSTATRTATADATATPTSSSPEKCDRVSPNSKRR
jgi:hypothetical protein